MLGDYETDDYINDFQWLFFIFSSMLMTVVLLNMVIAVMGDTYDKVQSE